jgi:hypothetical protein
VGVGPDCTYIDREERITIVEAEELLNRSQLAERGRLSANELLRAIDRRFGLELGSDSDSDSY